MARTPVSIAFAARIALVVALAVGALLVVRQLSQPVSGFALVDESTLVVLRGRVELPYSKRHVRWQPLSQARQSIRGSSSRCWPIRSSRIR